MRHLRNYDIEEEVALLFLFFSRGYFPRCIGRISKGIFQFRASLVAQTVKHLPVIRKTQVQSLGREDPLEKEIATHSSILAWRIPWTEETEGLHFMGSQRVGHD